MRGDGASNASRLALVPPTALIYLSSTALHTNAGCSLSVPANAVVAVVVALQAARNGVEGRCCPAMHGGDGGGKGAKRTRACFEAWVSRLRFPRVLPICINTTP